MARFLNILRTTIGQNGHLQFKQFSSCIGNSSESFIGYEELKESLKTNQVVYIDVRQRAELKNDGKIPGSFNIPLPELPAAFELNEKDFEAKYGFSKPPLKADNLIVGCLYAVRSAKARDFLQNEKGYSGIRVYSGGFAEWREKLRTSESN